MTTDEETQFVFQKRKQEKVPAGRLVLHCIVFFLKKMVAISKVDAIFNL